MIRRVTSQAEFDAAIAAQDEVEVGADLVLRLTDAHRSLIRVVGQAILRLIASESSNASVVTWGSSNASVVTWGSSKASVVTWGSSKASVVTRESSNASVVTRESSKASVETSGSSNASVETRESSNASVVAKGISQLMIRGAVKVVAAAAVAIAVLGGSPVIEGGGFVARLDISTPRGWCDYHGVDVHAGVAILFKVVDLEFRTPQKAFLYQPGTVPVAPDWDGGQAECGGGLHFSPTPYHALNFAGHLTRDKRRFVACPVALAGLAVHPDGQMPDKVKAKGLAGPCWEVDEHGRPVDGAVVWTPPALAAGVVAGRKAKSPATRRAKTSAKRRGGK